MKMGVWDYDQAYLNQAAIFISLHFQERNNASEKIPIVPLGRAIPYNGQSISNAAAKPALITRTTRVRCMARINAGVAVF